MFRTIKKALISVTQISILEERLNSIQATLSATNVKVAELELHNAGMHAAMMNLMLRNEALLSEINRSLRYRPWSAEGQNCNQSISSVSGGVKEARSTE